MLRVLIIQIQYELGIWECSFLYGQVVVLEISKNKARELDLEGL